MGIVNDHYLSSIRNWKNTSIAMHFNDGVHKYEDDFRIGIIDQNVTPNEDLRIREGIWIGLLDTVNRGLNERNELHFNHSTTCMPYTVPRIEEVRTLDLKAHRRNVLAPKCNPVRT